MGLSERLTSWVLIAVLTVVWSVPASLVRAFAQDGEVSGRRIALVIGNSDYASAETLKNPVNDSRAIADTLTQLGFAVTEVENADRKAFARALGAFEKAATTADAAVFYYSGHGFQLSDANYLVPTDAKLSSKQAIGKETIRLDDIVKRVQGRNRQTLFFIDACRNNPLPESVRGKDAPNGLAQIKTGSGTFVAFATQPGNISRDGAGDHSPFTEALLDNMTTPGISISDMMIRVRNAVEDATADTQTPWDQSSLRSQFYFAPEEEEDAALTDEDKDLLLSLDPALRAKFEQRFGIQIKEAAEEDEEPEQIIASIQPRFLIQGLDDSDAAPAAPGPRKPIGTLMILPGDAAEGSAAVDEPSPSSDDLADPTVAALDPEAAVPSVPLPQSRPEPPAAEPSQPVEAVAPEYGPFVPAPVTPVVARAAPSAPEQRTIAVAALDADATSMARSTGVSLAAARDDISVAAVMNDATVIRGEDVTPGDLAAAAPEPAAQAELLAPTRTAALTQPDMTPSPAPVVVQDFAVSVPAAAAAGSVTAVVESARSATVANRAEGAALPAASVALVPIPSIPLGPKLTPARSQAQSIVGQEKIELASVAPDEIEPPLIERAPPQPDDDAAVETEPVPTEEQRKETARLIQGELTRLGCYRNSVDGQWGNNSARGLLRYYATKKEAPDNLEPSDELLARLRTEDSVVCTRTETAKPKQDKATRPDRPKVARNAKPDRPAVRRSEPQQKASKPSAPRAPREASGGGGGGAAQSGKLSKKLKLGGLR